MRHSRLSTSLACTTTTTHLSNLRHPRSFHHHDFHLWPPPQNYTHAPLLFHDKLQKGEPSTMFRAQQNAFDDVVGELGISFRRRPCELRKLVEDGNGS
jgi:hypothetical protein